MHRRDFLAAAAGATTLGGVAAATGTASAASQPTLSPLATHDVSRARDFVTDDDAELAYVAAFDGFVVVDVADPANPSTVIEVRSLLTDNEKGPLDAIRDVKVHGDRLLVAGQQWANAETGTAVALYDVSDPGSPERLTVHETAFPVHNVAFDGDAAYLTASETERWPVVVLDVTDGLREVARWSVIDVNEQWADVKPGVRRVHAVHLDGDRLYVANWDAGTRVLDVSDPTDPTEVAVLGGREPTDVLDSDHYQSEGPFGPEVLELPGNSTAARTNGDGTLLAVPKEAFDMPSRTERRGGPGPIDVWDVSDLDDPEKVVTLAPPAGDKQDVGNAKNCEWRGDRLYTAWRQYGVRAYDLSDPSSPTLLAENTEFDAHTARTLPEGFAGLQHTGPDGGTEKPGRLFTFPEPSGDDATPAATGSPLDEPRTRTPTATQSRTSTQTETATPAGTTMQAGTTVSASTGATPDTATTERTDVGSPGFTALAGLASGALALAVRTWQRGRD